MTNEYSLKKLVKEEGITITTDDLAGALEIVPPSGQRKQVCQLPAYDPDSLDTVTAWNAPKSVLLLEKNKLMLCLLQSSSKPGICYTAAPPSNNGEFSKLRQVAWDVESKRFVVLEYRRKVSASRALYDSYALTFFDSRGKKVREIQEVQAFKKHRGASIPEVIESPNGRYLAGIASYDGRSKMTKEEELFIGCDLLTGKVVEQVLPAIAPLRCLSVTPYGEALLGYFNHDPLSNKAPNWKSMEIRSISIS